MKDTEQLDGYGLPRTEPAAINSQLAWERRWSAVLLEYPYNPAGLYEGKFSQFMGYSKLSRELLHGTAALRLNEWRDYAHRWEKIGVNPELFALVLTLLPGAIDAALLRAAGPVEQFELHDRLRSLNIDGGQWGMNGQNLVPEHWADFPCLFQKVGPTRALHRFITAGCGARQR